MSLKDTLRKAAEVFVDMPDEDSGAKAAHPHPSEPASAHAEQEGMADIDRRLAEMSQRLAGGTTPAPAEEASPKLRIVEGATPTTAEGVALSPLEGGAPETLDIAAIYARAGVPSAPFTAEQALEMVHSLPANLPLEVKRQTVQVTVGSMGKAIGATPESIAQDAVAKRDALTAYVEESARQSEEFVQAAEFEIAEMERQIEAKRAAIFDTRNRQTQVKQQCDAEAARLGEIVAFLSAE